ncbi:MAG: hypothetical protein ACLUFN_05275 [Eubacterium sp.]
MKRKSKHTPKYQRKYQLDPSLTNRYCINVYNPTVQPDGKTEMGVPIPTTENVEFSKEYEEENEL